MKYHNELLIALPRDQVVDLFKDPENLHYWQPELISFEPGFDAHDHNGSQAKLVYKMGFQEVEMLETILDNHLPDYFSVRYEAKGVHNIQDNHFEALNDHQTRWSADSDFRFSGLMSVFAYFMPQAFQKQSLQYMLQFKQFAECQEKQAV